MDQTELENDQHSGVSIDVIDIRRLREAIEHLEGSTRRGKVRRAIHAAVYVWALSATILLMLAVHVLYETQELVLKLQAIPGMTE